VLIQINLLLPGSQTVVGERLVDTVIGGIIASIFSFVLPSWEYRAIPRLVENVLQANRKYISATRDLLLRKTPDDFAYRIQRKQFMDNLSALISSSQRMLDEPRSRHRAVDNLSRFIVQNYLVAAHVAAARIQVREHYGELDIPAAETAIEQATTAALRSLNLASERLAGEERHGPRGAGFVRTPVEAAVAGVDLGQGEPARTVSEDDANERRARIADSADRRKADVLTQAAAAGEIGVNEPLQKTQEQHATSTASSSGRAANALLERRLRALREDAAKIALRTGAIGRAIRAPMKR
jgi:hypothetical protein